MAHEFDGRKYERASTHQKEWGEKLIAGLPLKGDERVLDLGCGDGTNTVRLATLLPAGEVVGIDASTGMIHAARPKEKGNVRFLLMDINDIDFKDEFDLIFSNATLHWVTDHRRLLDNVYKALREGGIVRFNFAADGNCAHFFKVVRTTMNRMEFSGYFADFSWPWYMPTLEEYTRLFDNTRFHEVRVWGENADRFFPDTEAMIAWIDQPSIVPFLSPLAEKDTPLFRNHVVDEMIKETRHDDGRCFETFRRINLFARK